MKREYVYPVSKSPNLFVFQLIGKFCMTILFLSVLVFLYLFFYPHINNGFRQLKKDTAPIYETPAIKIPKISENNSIDNKTVVGSTAIYNDSGIQSTQQVASDESAKDAQKIFVAYELGDKLLASRLIVDFISDYPNSTYKHKVRLIGAHLMNERGDYEGALEYIRTILGESALSNEDYSEVVLLLGAISRERKQYDSYIQTFLEQAYFKAQEPTKSKLAFYLGYLMLHKGEHTTALRYFNQVIGEDGVLGKADLYQAQAMRPERINELENFITAYPSSKNFDYVKNSFIQDVLLQGNDLVNRGYLDSAVKIYSKILRYFPNSSAGDESLLKIADIHYKKKEYKEAVLALHKVLSNDDTQKDADALFVLGRVSFEMDRPEEALAYFRRLTESFPKSPYISKAREWQNLISESLRN